MGHIIINKRQLGILVENVKKNTSTILSEATLAAPLAGTLKVNSAFSPRRCLSGQKCRAHNGTDYKASSGTKALAISSGVVSNTSNDSGACGGTIVIKYDNGYKSSYCHMKRIDVKEKQRVNAGEVLIRQRGTRYLNGDNVRRGKDDTLYAAKEGTVAFSQVKKKLFNGGFRYATRIEIKAS